MNIIYATTGEKHTEYLTASYKSLRNEGYTDKVTVITDKTTRIDIDGVEIIRADIPGNKFANRILKTSLPHYADDDINLYIDSDTIITNPITPIFDLLHDDLGLALDVKGNMRRSLIEVQKTKIISKEEADESLTITGDSFPHYNSGVILFRNTPEIRAFFDLWRMEWEKYSSRDQWALARALAKSGVGITKLPRNYNFYQKWDTPEWAKAHRIVIMHFLGARGKQAWDMHIKKNPGS